MTKEEARKIWPTSSRTLHIPLQDFMKLPCGTPAELISALKVQLRMHGIPCEKKDMLDIRVNYFNNIIVVESYDEVPF